MWCKCLFNEVSIRQLDSGFPWSSLELGIETKTIFVLLHPSVDAQMVFVEDEDCGCQSWAAVVGAGDEELT